MADESNLGRPELPPPPPSPVMFGGFALAFAAATTIALVMGQCDVGTVLSFIAALFAAATFFLLLGSRGSRSVYFGPSLTAKEKERSPQGGGPAGGPNDPTHKP